MSRWIAVGVVLGLVAGTGVVLAAPGSAQSEPLEATIEPTRIVLGGGPPPPAILTLRSVDPCLDAEGQPGRLRLVLFHEAIEGPAGGSDVDLTVEEHGADGQWVIERPSPDQPTGTWRYEVTCFPDDSEEPIGEYVPLFFEVLEPNGPEPTVPSTTTTAPPVAAPPAAPPAVPVPAAPDFVG